MQSCLTCFGYLQESHVYLKHVLRIIILHRLLCITDVIYYLVLILQRVRHRTVVIYDIVIGYHMYTTLVNTTDKHFHDPKPTKFSAH